MNWIIRFWISFSLVLLLASCLTKKPVQKQPNIFAADRMTGANAITLEVLAMDGQPLLQCEVEANGPTGTFKPGFNALKGLHEFKNLTPGMYEIIVSVPGYATWKKTLQYGSDSFFERAILGKKGMEYYHKSSVRVPYQRENQLLGVVLGPVVTNPDEFALQLEKEYGLRRLPSSPDYTKHQLFVFEYPPGIAEVDKQAYGG
jgi:hypothetical protein